MALEQINSYTCGAATCAWNTFAAVRLLWQGWTPYQKITVQKRRVATCGPAARVPGSAPVTGAAGGGVAAGVAAGVGTGAGGGVGALGLACGLVGPAAASCSGPVGTATADGSALAAGACHNTSISKL